MPATKTLCALELGSRTVLCEFTQKRVKNVNIRVKPDGSVAVSYPAGLSLSFARRCAVQKAGFILRSLEKLPRPQGAGGRLFYHGSALEIRAFFSETPTFSLENGVLRLGHPFPEDPEKTRAAAEKALCGIARRELTGLCLNAYPLFGEAFPFPELHFKKMTSRWGSCSPKNNSVTLNLKLISVPPECAEYVVCHEFAHFLQPNHSPAFYAELARRIPDWKERKKLLNQSGAGL
ncbi:MAG: SprT family zinc-dependent metalloprotease [Clostridiales bacterium]|nr:SprT family zinc-dependent metalloprotease [Clostridiales bacterium]